MSIGDERLGVRVNFTCLNKAEAAKDRTELARNLLDVLFSKPEKATCTVSGKAQEKGQLDTDKLAALKSM